MDILRPLIHGGDLTTCLERYPSQAFLDFSANINPLGLPESVVEVLSQCSNHCVRYPDPQCRELRKALSQFEEMPEDWILCGNGAADLIYRIVLAVKPRKALLLAPTFSEYEQALLWADVPVEYRYLHSESSFAPPDDLPDNIPAEGLVFLCNPNNPTGRLEDREFFLPILQACKEKETTIVVDECFLEFLQSPEEYTLKPLLKEYPNLIVLRAFTKIFAIPGLRLGYLLCANAFLSSTIDRAGAPWSVSVPAQLCGIAAVKEQEYLEETRRIIAEERLYLQEQLAELGFAVFPGTANYILFCAHSLNLAESLLPQGIVLRDCANFRGLEAGFYRIAVRTREENNKLLAAIKKILQM